MFIISFKKNLMTGRNHNGTFQQIGIHKNAKLLYSKIITNKIKHIKDKGLMLLISKHLLEINMKTANNHREKGKRTEI